MPLLTELTTYDDVMRLFSWDRLWALFDGDREHMNLAHECLDRHRDQGPAISVKFADGHSEHYDYATLTDLSSRFANWLTTLGIGHEDRVAIVLDPGKAFYVSLFGTIKRGAVAVPLFTLFGPEGLALRLNDCQPRLLLTEQPAEALSRLLPGIRVVTSDDAFWAALQAASPIYTPDTHAADLAVLQYTSGTTRALPEAVKHTHRSVVTVMIAALYGVGLRPGAPASSKPGGSAKPWRSCRLPTWRRHPRSFGCSKTRGCAIALTSSSTKFLLRASRWTLRPLPISRRRLGSRRAVCMGPRKSAC